MSTASSASILADLRECDGASISLFQALAMDSRESYSGLQLNIPLTVYIEYGQPRFWFYNASDGVIRRGVAGRDFEPVDDVEAAFLRAFRQQRRKKYAGMVSSQSDEEAAIVAVLLSVPPPSHEIVEVPRGTREHSDEETTNTPPSASTTTVYLSLAQFREYVRQRYGAVTTTSSRNENASPAIDRSLGDDPRRILTTSRRWLLQSFVEPQGWYNTAIRATWSPRVCFTEAVRSPVSLKDLWKRPNDRGESFESPLSVKVRSIPQSVIAAVELACNGIAAHLSSLFLEHSSAPVAVHGNDTDTETTSKEVQSPSSSVVTKIDRMLVYFKISCNHELVFLMSGSLRAGGTTAPQHSSGSTALPLDVWHTMRTSSQGRKQGSLKRLSASVATSLSPVRALVEKTSQQHRASPVRSASPIKASSPLAPLRKVTTKAPSASPVIARNSSGKPLSLEFQRRVPFSGNNVVVARSLDSVRSPPTSYAAPSQRTFPRALSFFHSLLGAAERTGIHPRYEGHLLPLSPEALRCLEGQATSPLGRMRGSPHTSPPLGKHIAKGAKQGPSAVSPYLRSPLIRRSKEPSPHPLPGKRQWLEPNRSQPAPQQLLLDLEHIQAMENDDTMCGGDDDFLRQSDLSEGAPMSPTQNAAWKSLLRLPTSKNSGSRTSPAGSPPPPAAVARNERLRLYGTTQAPRENKHRKTISKTKPAPSHATWSDAIAAALRSSPDIKYPVTLAPLPAPSSSAVTAVGRSSNEPVIEPDAPSTVGVELTDSYSPRAAVILAGPLQELTSDVLYQLKSMLPPTVIVPMKAGIEQSNRASSPRAQVPVREALGNANVPSFHFRKSVITEAVLLRHFAALDPVIIEAPRGAATRATLDDGVDVVYFRPGEAFLNLSTQEAGQMIWKWERAHHNSIAIGTDSAELPGGGTAVDVLPLTGPIDAPLTIDKVVMPPSRSSLFTPLASRGGMGDANSPLHATRSITRQPLSSDAAADVVMISRHGVELSRNTTTISSNEEASSYMSIRQHDHSQAGGKEFFPLPDALEEACGAMPTIDDDVDQDI